MRRTLLSFLSLLVLAVGVTACGSSGGNSSPPSSAGTGASNGLRLAGPAEFRNRFAGLRGLKQVYGLSGFAFTPLNIGLQYEALDQGKVDVANVFTTDGALLSGKYRLLTDPEGLFGFQNVAMVISKRSADAQGEALVGLIDNVSAKLTTNAMRQMNAAVDVDKLDPKDVAQKFLRANGLLMPGRQGQGKPALTLGDKNFTEQYLLGELYKQALEAKGFTIELKANIGSSEIADKALDSGRIDLYPEYTGVIVQELEGAKKLPTTGAQTYREAKAFEEKRGFVLTRATPFEDKDALATTKDFAAKNGLKSVPDLGKLLK